MSAFAILQGPVGLGNSTICDELEKSYGYMTTDQDRFAEEDGKNAKQACVDDLVKITTKCERALLVWNNSDHQQQYGDFLALKKDGDGRRIQHKIAIVPTELITNKDAVRKVCVEALKTHSDQTIKVDFADEKKLENINSFLTPQISHGFTNILFIDWLFDDGVPRPAKLIAMEIDHKIDEIINGLTKQDAMYFGAFLDDKPTALETIKQLLSVNDVSTDGLKFYMDHSTYIHSNTMVVPNPPDLMVGGRKIPGSAVWGVVHRYPSGEAVELHANKLRITDKVIVLELDTFSLPFFMKNTPHITVAVFPDTNPDSKIKFYAPFLSSSAIENNEGKTIDVDLTFTATFRGEYPA